MGGFSEEGWNTTFIRSWHGDIGHIFKSLVEWRSYFYACPSWLTEFSKPTLNVHDVMLCLPPESTQSLSHCVPCHPHHLVRSLVSLKAQVGMPANTQIHNGLSGSSTEYNHFRSVSAASEGLCYPLFQTIYIKCNTVVSHGYQVTMGGYRSNHLVPENIWPSHCYIMQH